MTVVTDFARPPAPKRRRPLSRLTRLDKLVLVVMCGIPTLLLLAFVWIPTLASVALSFTSWDGIGGIGTRQWVGGHRPHKVGRFPHLPPVLHDFPAVLARGPPQPDLAGLLHPLPGDVRDLP